MQLTLEGIKKKPDTGQTDLLYDILRYIRDFKRVDKIVRCYKKNTKESIQTLKKFDFRKGEDPTKDESTLDKYLEEIELTYIKWSNLGQEIGKIEQEINTLKKTVGNTIMDQSRAFKKELIEFKQR